VIKTLVFSDERDSVYLMLMHGNLEVSAKNLARQLDCKSLSASTPVI
jgi:prolyl-tRNA editing enzyme YbaK/EbsC (Cys-tRNA(Pro) deacylase)